MRAFRAKHGHVLPGSESKDAEVVRTMDVICMKVGKPDRVDEPYPLPHQLKPQLRRKVNQKPTFGQLEERAMAGTPVPGIRRGACRAMTPDNGDPEGSSGPEESELHA
jgi:hypothetical protein